MDPVPGSFPFVLSPSGLLENEYVFVDFLIYRYYQ